jgi:transcriptional regulator NrdR family protein
MKCPQCSAKKLFTVETFQTDESTVRTKKCLECKWTFTSLEVLSDDVVIPNVIRTSKRRPGATQ